MLRCHVLGNSLYCGHCRASCPCDRDSGIVKHMSATADGLRKVQIHQACGYESGSRLTLAKSG